MLETPSVENTCENQDGGKCLSSTDNGNGVRDGQPDESGRSADRATTTAVGTGDGWLGGQETTGDFNLSASCGHASGFDVGHGAASLFNQQPVHFQWKQQYLIADEECCRAGWNGVSGGEDNIGQTHPSTGIPGKTSVAIDIETTGLEADCQLTCVCTFDGSKGSTWYFPPDLSKTVWASHRSEIVSTLAAADHILAYNGAQFDFPVLARCLGERAGPWMCKLVDPLYAARALWNAGQKLDHFLALNGLPLKTGTGAHAVDLAREGRWTELGNYCMGDTRRTYDVIMARGWWADGIRYDPWDEGRVFRFDEETGNEESRL